MSPASSDTPYVSRAGLKLSAALDGFDLSPAGLVCADFGCNVGGFTDCLLQRGADKVYALDTGYGVLAWKLRKDPRVVVMERTNILHAEPLEPVNLVVMDVGWTPLRLALPAARRWLTPDGSAICLLKPHYEASADQPRSHYKRPAESHVLDAPAAHAQCLRTCQQLAASDWTIQAAMLSPLTGAGGNLEFLIWVRPK